MRLVNAVSQPYCAGCRKTERITVTEARVCSNGKGRPSAVWKAAGFRNSMNPRAPMTRPMATMMKPMRVASSTLSRSHEAM